MRLQRTLDNAVRRAIGAAPKFMETMEDEGKKETVFNYRAFTDWCHQEFQSNVHLNTPEEIHYLIRDLALEKLDPNYNHRIDSKTHYFCGYPTID